MGLTLVLGNGKDEDDKLSFSYSGFTDFRCELIGQIYGEKYKDLLNRDYRSSYSALLPLTDDEKKDLYDTIEPDLLILVNHADDSGKLSWQECKKLYDVLSKVHWKSKEYSFDYVKMQFENFRDLLNQAKKRKATIWFH